MELTQRNMYCCNSGYAELGEERKRVLLALADVIVANPVPWAAVLRDVHGMSPNSLKRMFFEEVMPACASGLLCSKPVVRGRVNPDAFYERIAAIQQKRTGSSWYDRWFKCGVFFAQAIVRLALEGCGASTCSGKRCKNRGRV